MPVDGTIKTLYSDKQKTEVIFPRTVVNAVGDLSATLATKQDTLVSGTNIKTINNQSLLGSGNIEIQGGGEPDAYLKNASVSGNVLTITKKNNTTVTFTDHDTTYNDATTSTHGLMSTADKTKLDGVATGATNVVESTVSDWGFTKNTGTITGITMNGSSKGTSGVVDLGTVITSHQDISGKADKISTVSNVAYDTTNKKITKTINGTTSDVVSAATLKTDMSLGNVENKSSATIRSEITASNIPNLDASKITSGTFADARIASASTWNAKQNELTAGNNINISSDTISALKYYKKSEVTGVAGTSTTQLSSTYDVTDARVTEYYDGMLVTFVLPVAGVSTYGSVFQFNSLGYKPIVYGTNSIVGTRYPVGGQITMIYNSIQTASAYLTKNVKTTITGCWQVCDYDTSTKDATKVFDQYFRPYAGASAIYRYKLCALDKDNRVAPITITNQESATQVAKTPNSVGLKTSDLWVYNSTTNISASKVIGAGSLATTYYGDNMCAYNFNASIPAYRMIYLRGTYDTTTGLFTLYNDSSSPCTSYYTSVPNNTANITLSTYFVAGYYYWLVGSSYSTADYLQVFGYNPLYYFDGTNLIPYQEHLIKNKISEPATEGTLGQVLTTDGAGGRTWTTVQSGGVSDVKVNDTSVVTEGVANIDLTGKQDILISGTNIKTINNQSILGSGNISPMEFKGGAEYSSDIPTASVDLVGNTYKVDKDGTYAGVKCKAGDLLICRAYTNPVTDLAGTTWKLNEEVSVAPLSVDLPVSNTYYDIGITTNGSTYVGFSWQNNGSSNNFYIKPDWTPGSGTQIGELNASQDKCTVYEAYRTWTLSSGQGQTHPQLIRWFKANATQVGGTTLYRWEPVRSGENFMGTLGDSISDLPTAAEGTVGWMYDVGTSGTYGGVAANKGDLFVCRAYQNSTLVGTKWRPNYILTKHSSWGYSTWISGLNWNWITGSGAAAVAASLVFYKQSSVGYLDVKSTSGADLKPLGGMGIGSTPWTKWSLNDQSLNIDITAVTGDAQRTAEWKEWLNDNCTQIGGTTLYEWVRIPSGSSAAWGSITGTLSDQTDLNTALSNKLDTTGGTISGNLTVTGSITTQGKPVAYVDSFDSATGTLNLRG